MTKEELTKRFCICEKCGLENTRLNQIMKRLEEDLEASEQRYELLKEGLRQQLDKPFWHKLRERWL